MAHNALPKEVAGWMGRRFHLEKNEVFDTEMFALLQMLNILLHRKPIYHLVFGCGDSANPVRRAGLLKGYGEFGRQSGREVDCLIPNFITAMRIEPLTYI